MPEWSEYMPSHLIDYAFKEASNAFKTAITNLKNNNRKFYLKFKSKKRSIKETIAIEKCFINVQNNTLFPGCMKKSNVDPKFKSNIAFSVVKGHKDGYLTYNRILKKWYLRISYNRSISSYKKERNDIYAMDPGERDFQTGYAVDHVFTIGSNSHKQYEVNWNPPL